MTPLSRQNVLVGARGVALARVFISRSLIAEQRVEQQLRSRRISFSLGGDYVTQGLVRLEDKAPAPIKRHAV